MYHACPARARQERRGNHSVFGCRMTVSHPSTVRSPAFIYQELVPTDRPHTIVAYTHSLASKTSATVYSLTFLKLGQLVHVSR